MIGLLSTVPGVSAVAAPAILSEIGADMSRFETAGHLVAWTGLCSGQNESAGKRKSSRLRKGAPWLKTMLVQCAWAARPDAGHKKPSAPSPPRSSPPSTTSSRTAPSIVTSAPPTSIAGPTRSKRTDWSPASKSSASPSNSSQRQRPPDASSPAVSS
ncbi:IS110 family transposase [Bradyrhizobium sp. 186]|nr:IS110 family transposase [Bradyrhizobium sp. 186]